MGLGINKVSSTVRYLCEMAGIKIDRNDKKCNNRNQSLRATSLTRLHQDEVEEQVVKEFSGHRSNAVRTYKVTPNSTHRENCKIIQGETTLKAPAATISKPPTDGNESHSDSEVFEPPKMEMGTPLKRGSDAVEPVSSTSNDTCNFIEKMSAKKKYKRLKVNIEFIESD